MRPRIFVLLLLTLGWLLVGWGAPGVIEDDQPTEPITAWHSKQLKQARPLLQAKAAIVVDDASGRVLFESHSHQRLPPASLTKIMTAIVAVDSGRLDEVVDVDVNAWKLQAETDSSVMGITPGERLTIRDLLYGLMMVSGNDAAIAIAKHLAGSEEKFVELMNAKVRELGLKDTQFRNSHGLHHPEHFTTAYDLAALTRHGMQNPIFADLANRRNYKAQGVKQVYDLYNINRFFGRFKGADGVKTGYTEEAGRCVVASATQDGHRVITVVLNSPDYPTEATWLMEYAFDFFQWQPLDLPPTAARDPSRSNGLAVRRSTLEPLASWERSWLHSFLWLDGQASGNERAGTVAFYAGSRFLRELPVVGKQ
ncbi:MAG: D-alanyl-D-alanine carboxypeptidase [Chloroflexi bacterium]|nr:D-alanyl-D-alanine carboxypeptidase [Chloroflexota bacterium]